MAGAARGSKTGGGACTTTSARCGRTGTTGSGETTLLLAHARSAFRDEGIRVENNMPFTDGRHVFIFNGELRGVRIRERGRIGAEKVFNYVKRFDRGDMHEALERGLAVIGKRSRYVRAMNVILASAGRVHVACRFAEDPGYFQMWEHEAGGVRIVCSDPYPARRRLVAHRQRGGADPRAGRVPRAVRTTWADGDRLSAPGIRFNHESLWTASEGRLA